MNTISNLSTIRNSRIYDTIVWSPCSYLLSWVLLSTLVEQNDDTSLQHIWKGFQLQHGIRILVHQTTTAFPPAFKCPAFSLSDPHDYLPFSLLTTLETSTRDIMQKNSNVFTPFFFWVKCVFQTYQDSENLVPILWGAHLEPSTFPTQPAVGSILIFFSAESWIYDSL